MTAKKKKLLHAKKKSNVTTKANKKQNAANAKSIREAINILKTDVSYLKNKCKTMTTKTKPRSKPIVVKKIGNKHTSITHEKKTISKKCIPVHAKKKVPTISNYIKVKRAVSKWAFSK